MKKSISIAACICMLSGFVIVKEWVTGIFNKPVISTGTVTVPVKATVTKTKAVTVPVKK